MAQLSIIAAMAHNNVIGYANRMPWHLSADLKHFARLTTGKVVIMGRATYESIGKALPHRHNVVLTRNLELKLPGVTCCHNLADAIEMFKDQPEIMIIGGANLYAQSIALCHKLYLTYIDLDVKGDRFFPTIQWQNWHKTIDAGPFVDPQTGLKYRFTNYERN